MSAPEKKPTRFILPLGGPIPREGWVFHTPNTPERFCSWCGRRNWTRGRRSKPQSTTVVCAHCDAVDLMPQAVKLR